MLPRHFHVVRPKSGCHVHHTGALSGGDKIRQHHIMRLFFKGQKTVRRLIAQPFQFGAALLSEDRVFAFLTQHLPQQFFGENQLFAVFELHGGVNHIRMHGCAHVAGQRPWGGRPDQQRNIGVILQREAHKHRRIGRIFLIAQ